MARRVAQFGDILENISTVSPLHRYLFNLKSASEYVRIPHSTNCPLYIPGTRYFMR